MTSHGSRRAIHPRALVINHNQSILGQNLRIMDDIVPPRMQNCHNAVPKIVRLRFLFPHRIVVIGCLLQPTAK